MQRLRVLHPPPYVPSDFRQAPQVEPHQDQPLSRKAQGEEQEPPRPRLPSRQKVINQSINDRAPKKAGPPPRPSSPPKRRRLRAVDLPQIAACGRSGGGERSAALTQLRKDQFGDGFQCIEDSNTRTRDGFEFRHVGGVDHLPELFHRRDVG